MKRVFAICCLLLVSLLVFAQETTTKNDELFPKIVLISSSAVLGVTYIATIIADATTGGKIDFPEIFIPGVGPLIAFARYDSYVSSSYSTASGRDTQKTLLALSGVIESLSIVGIVYGIIELGNSKKDGDKGKASSLSLEPFGLNGMKLVYRY